MLTHTGTNTIETERLILRRFKYTDDDAMLKYWIADEKIQSLYSEPVYSTKKAVKELLDKYINSYEQKDYYRWAVIEKKSGECIGQIAYFLVDNKNNFAEIEYCIGSDFQCRGFATEATKAIIAYGFDKINLHKVQICTKTINNASKRVIEKCGFTYEGTLRDFFYMNGNYVGRLYFSMLKSEFELNRKNENNIEINHATMNTFNLVKEITQNTIDKIYPKYYAAGAVDFFKKHHNDKNINDDLKNRYIYLMYVNKKPVATVTIKENHILRLFVMSEFQCKGYGGKLLDFAEKTIAKSYSESILDSSLPAKSIYLKRGYIDKEYHRIKTDNGDYLCYDIMIKSLQN